MRFGNTAVRMRTAVMGIVSGAMLFACSSGGGPETKTTTDGAAPTREKLLEILNVTLPKESDPRFTMASATKEDGYTISRVVLESDGMEPLPGYLLKPEGVNPPYPTMICLQGHTSGMHISIGKAKSEKDKESLKGGRDLALQAVKNGWAAVVIEQKGFGERAEKDMSCNDASLGELLKGTPMLGHRVLDVSRAVDFIYSQSDLDNQMIGCVGNSSGGTTSYFAACADERINMAVVSCSFATYESSWLKYHHCACGYLPGIMQVGDMPDFAALIAPRKLVIVAGKQDHIADIEGVREGFATAKDAFEKSGAPENLVLLEGDGGHQFYPDLAWPVINKLK